MDGTLWKKNPVSPDGKAEAKDPATMPPRAVASDAPQPTLTSQFCFSANALEDFLRTSRSAIDDSITEGLNALATPSSTPFDPFSASAGPTPSSRRSRPLDSRTCTAFRERILFPAWQARTLALEHCARVAAAPDPDDPDAAALKAEAERADARVVDERLDPYSGRFFASESRVERLARRIRQEQMVENIVRNRSWDVVRARCAGVTGVEDRWEGAFQTWRQGVDKGQSL